MVKGVSSRMNAHGVPSTIAGQNANSAFGFAGAVLWLDAAQGIPNQTNLGAVSIWTDMARGTQFTQQIAGNQPRWVASDPRYNNFPIVQGVSNTRRLVSGRFISNVNTLAFVGNYDTLNTGGNVILGYSLTNGNFVIMGGGFPGYNGVGTNFGGVMRTGNTEDASVKIAVLSKNGIWVNGVQEFVGNSFVSAMPYDTILGANNQNSYGLIGSLAELIGWSHEHDELSISQALNMKYAIY